MAGRRAALGLIFKSILEMRKFYSFMVAALAVMAAASCNKELQEVPQNSDKEIVKFTAFVDGADTKTVLDGNVSKWESGDAITILNGNNTSEFTTQDEGVSASFTGTALSGDKFFAVYPAEYDNHEYTADLEGKSVFAHIPLNQPSCEYSYSKNAAVAVAYTEDQTLKFRNATALLKFTVKGTNVKSMIFYGHNKEAVTGDVEILLNEDNSIKSLTAYETERVENEETISEMLTWAKLYADYPDDNYCFKEGVTYYMAVIPQMFTKGFTVQLELDGAGVVDVKELNKEKELKPNVIYDLGELEYIAPEIPVSKVYFKPNDNWTQANARFAAYFFTPGECWVDMTDPDSDGTYECEVPEGYSNVIFCRMNPETTENNWDNKWNQTSDLSLRDLEPVTNDCYYITPGAWDKDPNGYWSAIGETPEEPAFAMEIRGSWDGWADGIALTETGDYYAVKNRSFGANTEFKFVSSLGGWYGASGEVTINTELTVGGDNIVVKEAGTYDLYINKSLDKYYVMTAGKTPGSN